MQRMSGTGTNINNIEQKERTVNTCKGTGRNIESIWIKKHKISDFLGIHRRTVGNIMKNFVSKGK